MKKILRNITFLFILSIVILLNIKDVKAYVEDDVNVLGSDYAYIESRLESYEKANKCNILFRLYNEYGNIDKQTDYWYSEVYPNLKYDRSIIFAVNFASRETLIIGYDGYSWMNFYDNSKVVIETSPYLTREDYKGCIDTFVEILPREMATQKAVKIGLIILINLIIWNLILFFASKTYGNKDTTTVNTYLSENSRIVGKRDIFLRKTVTKTRKASSSSGGGGGGHSHGSGGHGHF